MGLFGLGKKKKKVTDSKGSIQSTNENNPKYPPQLPSRSIENLGNVMQSNRNSYHTDLLDLEVRKNENQTKPNINPIKLNVPSMSEGVGTNENLVKDVPDRLPNLDVPELPDLSGIPVDVESIEEVENEINMDSIQKQFNNKDKHFRRITERTMFIDVVENQINLNKIESSIRELNEGMKRTERLNNLKDSNDSNFEKYRERLEDIERRLVYLDKLLFNETLY